MGRDHGEIEFEFVEKTHGGEFLASGKVLGFLRNYLAKGEIELAATLLASCSENIGDQLIQEIIEGGASKQTMNSLSEMFFKARDFARAAGCAESAGNPAKAAEYYEANYELEKAAEQYLKARDMAKAAELFEKNLNFDRAAELFFKMRDYPRAAENFERAGMYHQAGQLYMKMSRWDKAVDVLQRVGQMEQNFVDSTRMIGQILEDSGNERDAMQRYLEVVRSKPLNSQTVEIHFRLGRLCAEQGLNPQARQLLDGVLGVNPGHDGAREAVALLESGAPIPKRRPAPTPAPSRTAERRTIEIAPPFDSGKKATPDRREPGVRSTGGFDFAPIDPADYEDDADDDVVEIKEDSWHEEDDVLDVESRPRRLADLDAIDEEDEPPVGVVRHAPDYDEDEDDEPPPLDLGLGDAPPRGGKRETLVGLDRHFEFLRKVELFKEFSLKDLKTVMNLCDRAIFRAGEKMIEQGEIGEALYILVKGEVEIIHTTAEGDEKVLGTLGPGDHVGELTLLDFTPSTAEVIAKTDIGAFRIPRKRFQDLLQGTDRMQTRLYRALIESLLNKLHKANAKSRTAPVF